MAVSAIGGGLHFATGRTAVWVHRSSAMQFTKSLRPRVQRGELTTSVRIWKRPHVKVGGRYALPPGEIEVTSIEAIPRDALTDEIARESGFENISSLLDLAQHGRGETVFVVKFIYHL